MRNPDLANSYLGGYESNMTTEVRIYLAVAAFVATPPETVLLSLMRDNRLLKHVPETKHLLELDVRNIWELPDLVAQVSTGGHGLASPREL